MFSNISSKIQGLAKVICWVGIVYFGLGGFASVFDGVSHDNTEDVILGFVFMIFGPLFSWIGSLLLYGFGQLIENTDEIVEDIYDKKSEAETKKENENT